ncbi:MAG: hypothetical protein M1825_002051 [Sarcosagium campestre]|nr:MAG: hypothetical protein M1825_002051 [Sarcosagium campestre]
MGASPASDHWTSYENLEPESDHVRKIEKLLSTADFHFLSIKATKIRQSLDSDRRGISDPLGETLTCSIDRGKFTSGTYNVVVELCFSDSERWVARIRLPNEAEDDDIETTILSEVATMNLVASNTTIPIPRVFGFDISGANQFGYRYILMESLPGHVPESRFSESIPESHWEKVADQLADIYHQLSNLRFDRIGRIYREPATGEGTQFNPFAESGPFTTSLDYFYDHRSRQSQMIKAAHPDDEQWATAAWILEQALPSMISEAHMRGPFPLCHMDLHYNNVLIDDAFNITGVVDWSDAQTAPVERFVVSPEFVTFPGLKAEENAPILAFRDKFVLALKNKEVASTGAQHLTTDEIDVNPISDLFGTPLWEIVYRCTYSYHWRALSDARLVLRQTHGPGARWEDFLEYYRDAPIHGKNLASHSVLLRF